MGRSTKMDEFAKIAAGGIAHRNGLIIPQAPKLEEKYLPSGQFDDTAIFKTLEKIKNKEELYNEVKNQRKIYDKFLLDFTPIMEKKRIRKYIDDCQWRIQSAEDKKDFVAVLEGNGDWQYVKLPHYGGPLGKETTYYRTVFEVTEEELRIGSIFICFKAVDYKAHVFINGCYLGSHEGFFAPFEFEMIEQVAIGENTLLVVIENDYICKGNVSDQGKGNHTGDKIYAATGIGYDDPQYGWHHCPPGMGIYQEVYIEARPKIFIKDLFVRLILKESKAEAWIEIYSCDLNNREISLDFSLYGRRYKLH